MGAGWVEAASTPVIGVAKNIVKRNAAVHFRMTAIEHNLCILLFSPLS
jgi:hypothetical protein